MHFMCFGTLKPVKEALNQEEPPTIDDIKALEWVDTRSKKNLKKLRSTLKKNPRPSQAGISATRSREEKDKRNEQSRVAWAARTDEEKEDEARKDRERRQIREARDGLDAINVKRRAKRAKRSKEEKAEDARKDKQRRDRKEEKEGKGVINAKRRAQLAGRSEDKKEEARRKHNEACKRDNQRQKELKRLAAEKATKEERQRQTLTLNLSLSLSLSQSQKRMCRPKRMTPTLRGSIPRPAQKPHQGRIRVKSRHDDFGRWWEKSLTSLPSLSH
ncbi:uncharacterized protein N7483_007083 [Penicillium malachiteum]|uniref:uncharacterized protein n=1 Tax=Penicillium malachiteum TaxID=1324776 RepID=UPI0025481B6D|nr:uncharacterized protein N7483_007083 [Penicillium malachiteum]KAJ5725726.1 hypothetical protein N7483_007083 [Penicillium malachiteum]